MDKIEIKIKPTSTVGVFHDSRKDIHTLTKVVNILIHKVNELVEENNKKRQ